MNSKGIGQLSTDFVKEYFSHISIDKKNELLPAALRSPYKWLAVYEGSAGLLTIFHVTENDLKRIHEYTEKGWHPLPLFLTSNDKVSPVAFNIGGKNTLCISNHVSNMFSFRVQPGASVAIQNHLQEFTSPSGEKINYKIDIAFALGLAKDEDWENIRDRLNSLLDTIVSAWQEFNDKS